MDFQHYTVNDFVMDDSFQQWILQGESNYWPAWLEAHPHKLPQAEEARQIIQSMFFKEDTLSQERYDYLSSQILHQVTAYEKHKGTVIPLRRKWSTWQVAASVSLLLLVGIGLYSWLQYITARVVHTTRYGETRTFTLPDRSTVVLNANSSLRYTNNWQEAAEREVWLEGEAFFSVEKKQIADNKVKFIVHTDDVQIEVLGTQFTVSKRKSNTRVILNEGQIKLAIADQPEHNNIFMQPGDWVQYEALQHRLTRKTVNAHVYSSWIKKKWILENTSLRQVAERIQETFGLIVTVPDTRLAAESMTGVIPVETLDEALDVLSTTYNLKITRKGNELLISRNPINIY